MSFGVAFSSVLVIFSGFKLNCCSSEIYRKYSFLSPVLIRVIYGNVQHTK